MEGRGLLKKVSVKKDRWVLSLNKGFTSKFVRGALGHIPEAQQVGPVVLCAISQDDDPTTHKHLIFQDDRSEEKFLLFLELGMTAGELLLLLDAIDDRWSGRVLLDGGPLVIEFWATTDIQETAILSEALVLSSYLSKE